MVTALSANSSGLSGGAKITIRGKNFKGAKSVKFGSTKGLRLHVNSASSLTVVVPRHGAGTVDVRVQTKLGTSKVVKQDKFTYYGAPSISAISPKTGPTAGGTTVSLSGANFSSVTKVLFGSTAGTGLKVSSSKALTVRAPSGSAGAIDVRVVTRYGTSPMVSADKYTYTVAPPVVSAPSVSSISPSNGPASGGGIVTITGTSLSGVTAVHFGGTAATNVLGASASTVTATIPAGTPSSTVDVTVTTGAGTSATSSADQYTYNAAPPVVVPPSISSITPSSGPTSGGGTITISGSNLSGVTTVNFGTASATVGTVSASSVTATVPAGTAGTVDVTVTSADGTSATSAADQYTYVAPPTVSAVSASSGPLSGGKAVTVTGTGFTSATSVVFGTTPGTGLVVNSATSITVTPPTGSVGTVDVTVTTPYGTSATSSADQYTYYAAPTVTGISPAGGTTAGGTSVTVTGTNLGGATAVNFGTAAGSGVTVNAAGTSLTVTSPPAGGAGAVNVTVTTPGGTSAANDSNSFTYVVPPAPPTVSSLNSTSGPLAGGGAVTITGTNLTGATAVHFGSNAATITANSSTSITVTVPSSGAAGTIDVTVTTANGTSAKVAGDQYTYVAAPTVGSISPTSGTTAGGTQVTVTGTNLRGAIVSFGSTQGTGVLVNAAGTSLTVTSPAESAGAVAVEVMTPGGAASSTSQFTYVAPPTVTGVSPTSGPAAGGTSVTVTGTGFVAGVTGVDFGSTPATGIVFTSSTSLVATAPAGTGTVHITVTSSGVTSTTSPNDEFTYITGPVVTSLNSTSGPTAGGGTVIITGTNLTGATAVHFGSNAATITANSSTSITVTVPPSGAAGTVEVTVTTPGGTSATSSADQYTYMTAPTVTSMSPTSGPTAGGTVVTIGGTNLTGATVNFGTIQGTGVSVNAAGTSLTVTSPAESAGAVDVQVITAGGTATSASQFTYMTAAAPPTVSFLTPNAGPTAGGTNVTISGTGFTGASVVKFGTVSATTFTIDSATQITATSPAGNAGTVDVTVAAAGGTSSINSSDHFTYAAAPTVTGMTPTSGPASGGTSVTITGTNLWDTTTVDFGNTQAQTFSITAGGTQLTVTSPPGSGTVSVSVITPGGSATSPSQFTYMNEAAITSVAPSAGPLSGGGTVTITGVDFAGATAVKFGANAATSFTVASATSITATVPGATTPGTVDVTVTTPTGVTPTTTGDQYTYYGGPYIQGTVTAPSGTGTTPVAGVVVTIDNGVQQTTTDANGFYSFSNLSENSTYTVCFNASGVAGAPAGGYVANCVANQTTGSTAASITTVNDSLVVGGSVSGTVTDASTPSDGVSNVQVVPYDLATGAVDYQLGSSTTSSTGAYTLTGIPAGSGYGICFQASNASGTGSATGYLSQCYNGIAWDGSNSPASTPPAVTVTQGSNTPQVNASLEAATAISGTVTTPSSGTTTTGLGYVTVTVWTTSGNPVTSVETHPDGTYQVSGLSQGSYDVCFEAFGASPTSSTGYVDQCYNGSTGGVTWNGYEGSQPPAGATTITTTGGTLTSGIDASIAVGGAISGTVTDGSAATTTDLGNVYVAVFDGTGAQVGQGWSDSSGLYTVTGLATGTYTVCFNPNGQEGGPTGGTSKAGYLGECYSSSGGVAWNGGTPPQSATGVSATEGSTTTKIDVALPEAAGISGTVTSAPVGTTAGSGLSGVWVEVYNGNNQVTSTETLSDGSYSVTGLTPGSYNVCFDARQASGGSSTAGYADQCYNNVAWSGNALPSGLGNVSATTGSMSSGISATLQPAASIAGTVTEQGGTAVLQNVEVEVFDAAGNFIGSTYTDASGDYTVSQLSPDTTYNVCFDTNTEGGVSGGTSQAGYQDQCYNSVAWNGEQWNIPASATAVTTGPASSTTTVNQALPMLSGISGTVTSAEAPVGNLSGVNVVIYNSSGSRVKSVTTGSSGSYSVTGLPAGNYAVCFAASNASGGPSNLGYLDQCGTGTGTTWDGSTAPTATPITTTAGAVDTVGAATLATAGGISGTVTSAVAPATGSPDVQNVTAEVVDQYGNLLSSATTDSSGAYTIKGLTPGTAYYLCFDGSSGTGGASTAGYLGQCYNNKSGGVPWAAGDALPSGAVSVTPTSTGTPSTGYNAALASAGGFSGTVTSTPAAPDANAPLQGVAVDVYDTSGNYVQSVTTAADGTFMVGGLIPGSSFDVCFNGANAQDPNMSSSYGNQCYQGVAWSGSSLPTGLTSKSTTAGTPTALGTIQLPAAGGITGVVTAAASPAGTPDDLQGVSVAVFDGAGNVVSSSYTDSTGTYTVSGLTPGAPYDVCFSAGGVTDTTSPTGYLDQCYNGGSGVAWDGSYGDLPAGMASVTPPGDGQSATADARLTSAGGISGKVTDTSSNGLYDVSVDAFSGGVMVNSANTDAAGNYTITGLTPGRAYDVCFDASSASQGTSAGGYLDQCFQGVSWNGNWGNMPSGLTPVTASSTPTSTTNASLSSAGGISGTVTAAGGAGVGNVDVDVYQNGNMVASVQTENAGTSVGSYSIAGLTPGQAYDVCFDASGVSGASSNGGYLDQCYNGGSGVAWAGPSYGQGSTTIPAGATAVSPIAGTQSTANAVLQAASGISGTVTAANGGAPLQGVSVDVLDASGNYIGSGGYTDQYGNYTATGLTPGSTYYVCFAANGGGSTTGYESQCHSNVLWDGLSDVPAGATPVSAPTGGTVAAGANAINEALGTAGAISGTVTDTSSPTANGLYNVSVQVFKAGTATAIAETSTQAGGTYTITGLNPGTYDVCFSGSYASNANSTSNAVTPGYGSQCYNGVAWSGNTSSLPTMTGVTVTSGATQGGVNGALAQAGGISGAITAASGGAGLSNVDVDVYDASGTLVGSSYTYGQNGAYEVPGLVTGSYTVCFDASSAQGGTSTSGYASECYNAAGNVAWTPGTTPSGGSPVSVSAGATFGTLNQSLPNG